MREPDVSVHQKVVRWEKRAGAFEARTEGGWTRPAAAVDQRKRSLLSKAAREYVRQLRDPNVRFRFDIVEVLLVDGEVNEVRHIPNAFPLTKAKRHA